MRVSLFGLFLRGTNLMEPWPKPVQSNLPVSDFTSDFRFYDYYIMPACILLYHSCSIPPAPVLILSYPEYSCLTSTCLHASAHDTVFNAWLWFGFIDTLVLISARHLAFASPLAWGVSSDSPGSSCPGHGAWSVWIPLVADQSGAAEAWISSRPSGTPSFQAPCVPLEFSFCKLVSALFTVHSCMSPCILAIAPFWWCNIIVISDHLWW